jgi:L-seryl-tRNA(Ser) seleniumtransferase
VGISALLRELTGAEAGLVVNNNAAAVLLALTALARGREVIVSRGELVEIGGAFRIPDVMAQSGARLKEVGTTNRTHLRDYEAAIGPDTALLLKVHTSNYRIEGFTAEVALEQLVELGRRTGIAVMEDLGSGSFVDLSRFGIGREPTVGQSVASGADLVTFSGDKLLGGPQAGLLAGRREAVEACSSHPLMRALRPDKLTLAALEATLALYRDPTRCLERVPTLRRLLRSPPELEAQARLLGELVAERLAGQAEVAVRPDVSEAGGGALPVVELPTWVVEVRLLRKSLSCVEERLRRHDPPVIARLHEGALLLDVRTLGPGEDRLVAQALAEASSAD